MTDDLHTQAEPVEDSLRSRIANAIWEELRTQNNQVNFDRLADAVIAALGLRQEAAHAWHNSQSRVTGVRYVTAWTDDELHA